MTDSSPDSSTPEADAMLHVGHIRRPHGLRGEVFVQLTDDHDARVAPGAELHLDDVVLVVESSRVASNGRRVVKFQQFPDRTEAEKHTNRALRGAPLDEPEALWVHQLIGGTVIDAEGITRGKCVAVLANPAADILELDSGSLVPSNFVVSNIDGVIMVDTPDGLFDLNS